MNDDDIDALVRRYSTLIQHMEISRFTTVAGFSVLIWDHFLTFSEEKRLIWPAPCSLVKVLFLTNRYATPVFQAVNVYQMSRMGYLSDDFCKRWTIVSGSVEITSLGISNFLLLLRVYALYERRRVILLWMLVVFALTYVSIITTSILSIVELYPAIHFSPIVKACTTEYRPKIMSAIWAAPIGFEVLIFAMTVCKALEHARNQQIHTPVLKSLYLDQLWYFLVIVVARILNLLVWVVFPSSLLFLGLYTIWSLVTAFVSRIMLNLRGVCNACDWADQTMLDARSDMEWAHDTGAMSQSVLEFRTCLEDIDEDDVLAGSLGASHKMTIRMPRNGKGRDTQHDGTSSSHSSPTLRSQGPCIKHVWTHRRARNPSTSHHSNCPGEKQCSCNIGEDIELDEIATFDMKDDALSASGALWTPSEDHHTPTVTAAELEQPKAGSSTHKL